VATENFSIVIHDGRVIRFILLGKISIFYRFNFIVLNIVTSVCGRFIKQPSIIKNVHFTEKKVL
jgi:hypothetical protein